MTNQRRTRASERDTRMRDDFEWEPPGILDAPPPRPGMVQRWIRTLTASGNDTRNVAKALNLKWRPRPSDTVEDIENYATHMNDRFGNVVGVEGMILMERPRELHDRYGARIRNDTAHKMDAIQHALGREAHDATHKVSSRVTTGRPLPIQDD